MTQHRLAIETDTVIKIAEGVFLLPGIADGAVLMPEINRVAAASPFRHMTVKGGKQMSAAMTNCGPLGWTSDLAGYRYVTIDPLSGKPWPDMPMAFRELATRSAALAGFDSFLADACLINRYLGKAQMGLHQDRDEKDFSQPIVSVSIGASAEFFLGGLKRTDRTEKILLSHGDVLVWGGPARLRFHGVKSPHVNADTSLSERYNLTLRKAA
jgi:DNA oxidative demethylase